MSHFNYVSLNTYSGINGELFHTMPKAIKFDYPNSKIHEW